MPDLRGASIPPARPHLGDEAAVAALRGVRFEGDPYRVSDAVDALEPK